ncbi:FAD/NAD(P)-binding protein [Ideonella sp.]|uniref:FAD/NAD(P)-binding protein n=1 Tax=Ideonella sp. TaxID=1929293 RepID=UPI002B49453D|nr:FAD/NAD(P)-binding protein [Ideonella sp.]HJV70387.1 FAD/NAD(P)-binding protein [Ideonella sp.]
MSTLTSTEPACVAVVGLGFSGTAVAIHLMRGLPRGSRLLLIEPAARRARGLAYGTRCASHWLNVPAGRLGLEPAHEAGFIDWLQRRYGAYSAAEFVPRMLLGDYLAEALAEAEQRAHSRGVQVQTLAAGVRAIEPAAEGAMRLALDDGSTCLAERVVLATGHLAPEAPRLPDVPGAPPWGTPGLIDRPWDDAALAALPEDGDLLLLGSGLSAIDLLTWLQDRGHAGRVTMLSRRGLLPQPHRSLEARPRPGLWPLQALADAPGLRVMLRSVRRWAAEARAEGRDWRDVMASLRASTPALWQRLTLRERRQFLRHLQPWWDTHRHRLAPGIQHRLQAALRTGQAEVQAGRLQAIVPAPGGGFEVRWRPRGAEAGVQAQRRVAAVVNCTGPSARVGHAPATVAGALLASLQAQGRLMVDELGLGLKVDAAHRLLDARGQPQPGLYYVGPMLKAQHWEAIAIPELRVHAQAVAEHLLRQVPVRAPA